MSSERTRTLSARRVLSLERFRLQLRWLANRNWNMNSIFQHRFTSVGRKILPVAGGDDLGLPVHHLDGGFVVDGVARQRHTGGPALGVGQGVFRQVGMVEVREDGEIHHPQGGVTAAGRLPADEIRSDARGHHHAAGAQPHPDGFAQRGQQVRQPGLAHPVGKV